MSSRLTSRSSFFADTGGLRRRERVDRLPAADGDEVDDEQQRLAAQLVPGRVGAVRLLRRDDQPPPTADAHPEDALVPALDDLVVADRERERRAVVPRRVELLAGGVVDADVVDGGDL